MITPPVISFTEEMVNVTDGTVRSITNSTMTDKKQEFVLHIEPTYITPSITIVVPEGRLLNHKGLRNTQSNQLTISLVPPSVVSTILSRSSTNQNPYALLIDFSAPIVLLPEIKHILCQNCRVQSVNAIEAMRLRVVMSIMKEGPGEVVLPRGIAVSSTGEKSEVITFPFYFGRLFIMMMMMSMMIVNDDCQ